MESQQGWFNRFVNGLPETWLFNLAAKRVLVPLWARLTPLQPLPGGPPPSIAPSDNVQRMMNLIMPLADKSPIGRAKAAAAALVSSAARSA